jgi:general secretion pathway protein K
MRRQRGIALILVLMVTGILGLLMLQVGLTAREQVARAQRLSDRVDADLRAHSREVALQYTLLTRPWLTPPGRERAGDNPYAAAWNFRGVPFQVDGVTFEIQDLSGLQPLPPPGVAPRAFVALLEQLGVEPSRAARLGDGLVAAQGVDPRDLRLPESARGPAAAFPLQSLAELRRLTDMDEALYARLAPLVTLFPTPGFNPLTAPPEVLATRFGGSQLEGVLELREQDALTETRLFALTGTQADEFTTTYPGPALRIRASFEHAGIGIRRETTVLLRPWDAEPFALWEQSNSRGEGA